MESVGRRESRMRGRKNPKRKAMMAIERGLGWTKEGKEGNGGKDALDPDNFTEDDRDLQFGEAW
jgi:hypothetical protein